MRNRHTICPEYAFVHPHSSPPSHSQIPSSIYALAEIANLTLMPCSPLALSVPRLSLLYCSLHIFLHSPYLPDSPRFSSLTPYLTLCSVFLSLGVFRLLLFSCMLSELEQEELLKFNTSVSDHREDYKSVVMSNLDVMGLQRISLDTWYEWFCSSTDNSPPASLL